MYVCVPGVKILILQYLYTERVCVKCNQTGKIFRVTVSALSRDDDGSLTRNDLFGGSQLLMKNNKKMYPVTV